MAKATSTEIVAEMEKVWRNLELHGAGKPCRVLVTRMFYDSAIQQDPEVFKGITVEFVEPING